MQTCKLNRQAPPEVSSGEVSIPQSSSGASATFGGRLILLIDSECASYCEDFVMPFKDNHRAILIGETTFGSYSQTYFVKLDNGMMVNVAETNNAFADGATFEGVGIAPDLEVAPTIEDLRSGRDVVLQKALAVASGR